MKRPSVKQALIAYYPPSVPSFSVRFRRWTTILNKSAAWMKRLVTARDIKGKFSDLKLAFRLLALVQRR